MVNKVRVTIAGAPYAIATTDTENYITTLAKKLDDDITKLLDNFLINVGRGPIVNDADLVAALNENQIAAAGLDVLTKEPVEADNPLNSIKDSTKLIVTPHIAWATVEARTRLMDEVYENIKAFTEGKARNVVG